MKKTRKKRKRFPNLTARFSEPFKQFANIVLSKEEKEIWRDAINLRVFSPSLSEHLILILGTQRSGTTLSLLMLQAHPQIKGMDETELPYTLPFPSSLELFWQKQQGKKICLKLPDHIASLDYMATYFPHAKILWAVRNPYSVVSSMCLLKNPKGSWIERCARQELLKLTYLFPEINEIDLDNIDDISFGTYVWYYKNLTIDLFKQRGLTVLDFKYEDLLENPQEMMRKILDFVGLEWSSQVLEYHKFHQQGKRYPGKTKGDKPLDQSRKNASINLTDQEKYLIVKIAQPIMDHYGY